jgi:hypothetical protein
MEYKNKGPVNPRGVIYEYRKTTALGGLRYNYDISNTFIVPWVLVYFGGCNKPGSFNPYFYGQRGPAYPDRQQE